MTTFPYRSTLLLAAAGVLSFAAGCGDTFISESGSANGGAGATGPATGGSTTSGTATSGGGGSGAGGGTGATGGTGGSGCTEGDTKECYDGPGDTKDVGPCKQGTSTCHNGIWGLCEGQVLPATEICDTLDNDCDGATDEVEGGCACTTNGASQECYSGGPGTMGVGVCKAGVQTCTNGSWGPCMNEIVPSAENCDNVGFDNNCNNFVDDYGTCDTALPDNCSDGHFECKGDGLVCKPNNVMTEICDGMDNNCDGVIDETFPNMGAGCVMGPCAGTLKCVNGDEQCDYVPTGVPEICGDMVDNDCDGVTDPPMMNFFADNFGDAVNTNWTIGPEWDIGPAVVQLNPSSGFFGDPAVDATPVAIDNRLAGVVIGGNASTVAHAGEYLTSKVIDLSAASSVVLTFQRFLNSDAAPKMTSTVEVNNGSGWIVVWQNLAAGTGFPVADSQWMPQAINVTKYKNANFQVRFGVAVGADMPVAVGSWSIDDVRILSCLPTP